VSAHSNWRFTDQEFSARKKRLVIVESLSGTCIFRTDFCSVIYLALINRLYTKNKASECFFVIKYEDMPFKLER
jgi:hypothetical protein